jgi:N6-adenosine-specific RNA methylase IME4
MSSEGACRVLFADPPWAYNDRREVRKDNPGKKPKFGIGVERRYNQTMSTPTICAMGESIKKVCASDAYLFLWVTTPRLDAGLEVMKAWGFKYKNIAFFWSKVYKGGETFKGPGSYVPSNVELVLFGVRGKPWHSKSGSKPAQEIRCTHPRENGKILHSRKPEDAQDRVTAWLGSQLEGKECWEIFATREKVGWKCLGYSLTNTYVEDELKSLLE